MSSFTIELVSNASTDVHPQNDASTFTNILPEQIHLDDSVEWEVALLEISHPTLFYNIEEGQFCVLQYADPNPTAANSLYYRQYMRIPSGLYYSINDVLAAMRDAYRKFDNDVTGFKWGLNNQTKTVQIFLPGDIGLKIESDDLAQVLGIPTGGIFFGHGPHESPFPYDIVRFHTSMIYIDIVEHSPVGDIKAPLLRCFPLETKLRNEEIITNQHMCHHPFIIPHYRRVHKRNFHSITIEMRSNRGEIIPFIKIGFTRLSLNFRKVLPN